jgi:hypothetical protein
VKVGRDRIEKNPDQRVQDALQLVFSKFAEFQSARQVHIWLRDEGIELPVKSRDGEARGIIWRLPAYNIVHNILTNPIYAGAYAFGRTTSRVSVENGRKRVNRRPIGPPDRHPTTRQSRRFHQWKGSASLRNRTYIQGVGSDAMSQCTKSLCDSGEVRLILKHYPQGRDCW